MSWGVRGPKEELQSQAANNTKPKELPMYHPSGLLSWIFNGVCSLSGLLVRYLWYNVDRKKRACPCKRFCRKLSRKPFAAKVPTQRSARPQSTEGAASFEKGVTCFAQACHRTPCVSAISIQKKWLQRRAGPCKTYSHISAGTRIRDTHKSFKQQTRSPKHFAAACSSVLPLTGACRLRTGLQ